MFFDKIMDFNCFIKKLSFYFQKERWSMHDLQRYSSNPYMINNVDDIIFFKLDKCIIQ